MLLSAASEPRMSLASAWFSKASAAVLLVAVTSPIVGDPAHGRLAEHGTHRSKNDPLIMTITTTLVSRMAAVIRRRIGRSSEDHGRPLLMETIVAGLSSLELMERPAALAAPRLIRRRIRLLSTTNRIMPPSRLKPVRLAHGEDAPSLKPARSASQLRRAPEADEEYWQAVMSSTRRNRRMAMGRLLRSSPAPPRPDRPQRDPGPRMPMISGEWDSRRPRASPTNSAKLKRNTALTCIRAPRRTGRAPVASRESAPSDQMGRPGRQGRPRTTRHAFA